MTAEFSQQELKVIESLGLTPETFQLFLKQQKGLLEGKKKETPSAAKQKLPVFVLEEYLFLHTSQCSLCKTEKKEYFFMKREYCGRSEYLRAIPIQEEEWEVSSLKKEVKKQKQPFCPQCSEVLSTYSSEALAEKCIALSKKLYHREKEEKKK